MTKLFKVSRFISRHKIAVSLIIFTVFAAATGTAVVIYSEWRMAKLVPGGLGERFPTKVYSSPFFITSHTPLTPQMLIERLVRLNYRPGSGHNLAPGQYAINGTSYRIYFRGFQTPALTQEPQMVTLSRTTNNFWLLADNQAQPVTQIALEPELASELSGPQKIRRDPASWDDFPPILPAAVIAVEDRRFFKHHGIDFRAVLRAAWFNLRHKKNWQGGSTITQQFVKNFFLTRERTLKRKVLEVAFAIYMDLRLPKEKILTLYLNHIYMGQDGSVSIAGARAAALFYFDKQLNQLTLPEAATLAGLIRSPYRYNPFQNPEAATRRRDTVLRLMLDEGMITEPEYEKARNTSLVVRKRKATSGDAESANDYFVAEVIRQMVPHFSEDVLFRYGLKIYTSLDPLFQKIAQRAVTTTSAQAAMVVLDPGTGRVLALVGGKNYRESQFNRATQARRQPGSAFKPFVYGAALENGFTPATILKDEPRAFSDGESIWAPQNFDNRYRGNVPLRQALAWSINGATLDLASQIGPNAIVRFAKKLGIESTLEKSLALALGTSVVSPLELTAAYAPFVNGGFRVTPLIVTGVEDADGNVLELNSIERKSVIDPALSFLMTSLLQTTVSEGTARSLATRGWTYPSAGKTGTTNRGRDAWFVGYTPDLLVGVWTGNDDDRPMNFTGAKDALPLWAAFMKQAYQGREAVPFEKPDGLTTVKLDPASGLLARAGCPDQKEELFLKGTQPIDYCNLHAGGLKGWFMKLFRKKPVPVENSAPQSDEVD